MHTTLLAERMRRQSHRVCDDKDCAVMWLGNTGACWACGGSSSPAFPPLLTSQHGMTIHQPPGARP